MSFSPEKCDPALDFVVPLSHLGNDVMQMIVCLFLEIVCLCLLMTAGVPE